ncbi:hypothetical protein AMTR_s04307p00000800 [Amborella trichopoda]|uniref:Uncharacterized protein n=1 Tax=Amborella trichopoda TaxID=13333 RepID=U5CZN5_AMBTC|nr:hypothetical protein AMTR_s04307p00000800 [Amborella trichopoda]
MGNIHTNFLKTPGEHTELWSGISKLKPLDLSFRRETLGNDTWDPGDKVACLGRTTPLGYQSRTIHGCAICVWLSPPMFSI